LAALSKVGAMASLLKGVNRRSIAAETEDDVAPVPSVETIIDEPIIAPAADLESNEIVSVVRTAIESIVYLQPDAVGDETYDGNVGEPATSKAIKLFLPTSEAVSLRSGEKVLVQRSSGQWSFGIVSPVQDKL
jgi:hypothetical protein